jgi:hypothetical protein
VSSVRIELVSNTGKTTVLKAKTPLLSGRRNMGKPWKTVGRIGRIGFHCWKCVEMFRVDGYEIWSRLWIAWESTLRHITTFLNASPYGKIIYDIMMARFSGKNYRVQPMCRTIIGDTMSPRFSMKRGAKELLRDKSFHEFPKHMIANYKGIRPMISLRFIVNGSYPWII